MLRRSLVVALAAGATAPLTGCWATICVGSPDKRARSSEVMWGFVLLDVMLGLWMVIPVGLIWDISTGAIYRPLDVGPRRLPPIDDQGLDDDPDHAVKLPTCPRATELARGIVPGHIGRSSRALRDHLEQCATCAQALVAEGPVVRLPRLAARPLHEPAPLTLALPDVGLSPEQVQARLEARRA